MIVRAVRAGCTTVTMLAARVAVAGFAAHRSAHLPGMS